MWLLTDLTTGTRESVAALTALAVLAGTDLTALAGLLSTSTAARTLSVVVQETLVCTGSAGTGAVLVHSLLTSLAEGPRHHNTSQMF